MEGKFEGKGVQGLLHESGNASIYIHRVVEVEKERKKKEKLRDEEYYVQRIIVKTREPEREISITLFFDNEKEVR